MEDSLKYIGEEIRLKICLLGNTSVGKTALLIRFMYEKFIKEDDDRTIEDKYFKYVSIKEQGCILEIIDTGGYYEDQKLLEYWIKKSDGFLLIYSINDKESFEGVKMRYKKIRKYKKSKKFYILIVGNKNDLEEEEDEEKQKRKVNKEEVENFCSENLLEYMEVSALKNNNVNDMFIKIGGKLLDKNIYSRGYNNKNFCCLC